MTRKSTVDALTFLNTDDPLEGAQSVQVFLDEMYDEHVLPQGKKGAEGDKTFIQVRAAARAIINFRTFSVAAIKDAFMKGDDAFGLLSKLSQKMDAKTPGGMLDIWYEGTKLEFALSAYQLKFLRLFVNNILPEFKRHGLPVTDELASLVVDSTGSGIQVPDKIRFAEQLFEHEKAKNGIVSKDAVQYAYKALNDQTISTKTFENGVRERMGRGVPNLLEGHVEIQYDGKRKYILITDDGLGELFEKHTDRLVDWRMG